MIDKDHTSRPPAGQLATAPAGEQPHSGHPLNGMLQPLNGSPVATAVPANQAQPRIWPGMTPEQTQAYIDDTKRRRSRKKQRPSLDTHRTFLVACVKGNAVMRQVFDDLIAVDPTVREEFGPDGYRTFNACVKRMAEG